MHGSAKGSSASLRGARLLAVEDDFVVLLEIATVLSNVGAAVVKCMTVAEALRAIDAEPFAAAVLDVRLGRETIAPVARRLSELDVPFLFYTGNVLNDAPMTQWAQARVVSKPAPAAVLVNAVAELLRSAEPRVRGR